MMSGIITILAPLAVCVRLTWGASGDPGLYTSTVQDSYGNVADSASVITWGNGSTAIKPYKTDLSYDDGGLGAFYDMMHGFINTIQPHEFPYDLMSDAINDISAITSNTSALVSYLLGFAICLAIGILSILIVPVVGCCFCCCRTCCNKCGGKKIQKDSKYRKCKKTTFTVLGFVCTIFMLMGFACMIVTNDQMSTGLGKLSPTIENNLDDLPAFINNTVGQIDRVALGGIKFTLDVFSRDLKSLGFLLGIPTRDSLQAGVGLDVVMTAVQDFETVIDTIGTQMFAVNSSIAQIKVDGNQLSSELKNVSDYVNAANTSCSCGGGTADSSTLVMDVNFTALPDITTQMMLLGDVQSQDLTQNVLEARKEFADIPWTVQNDTETLADDITSSVDQVYGDIKSALNSLTDIQDQTKDFVDPAKDDISQMLSPVTDYDKFRWLGLLALACIIGLIAFLQFFGLLCGACGTLRDPPPTERGCVGNCGGNLLMAATGLTFIFSWLLMLILVLFFVLGSNMETLLCRPLTDPQLKVLDLLEGTNGLVQSDGYILSNLLFGDASIELPIKGVLQSCRNNEAAMSALQLYRKFDINDALDWRKHVDIGNEIDNINVDFSTVSILSPDLEKQLTDFAAAVDIDYQGFVDEMEKDTTVADLPTFSSELRALETSSAGHGFGGAADTVDNIHTGIYAKVSSAQTQLLSDIRTLNASTQSVNGTVQNLLNSMRNVEQFLQMNGSDIVKQQAKSLQTRLEGVVDSFVSYANKSIFTDIGRCKPVSNLYDSMIGLALCKYAVDTLNGYWFALGIAVFFMMPSMIFNVKLAKHFRRMKYKEELDDPSVQPVEKFAYPESDPPIFASNKVAPQ